jgi:RecB family exonuclease
VCATESFEPGDLRFDGSVGGGTLRLPESLSPSRLETLALCPLRAFLRDILGVPDPERPDPDEADAGEAGRLVHAALRGLYEWLSSEGLLAREAGTERVLHAARARLPGAIEEAGREVAERLSRRHPRLWEAFAARLESALASFLEGDLPDLVAEGTAGLKAEETLRGRVRLEEGDLGVHGRIDRLIETHAGRIRISDYKTGRNPGDDVSRARRQRGLALQLPLYALLAGDAWPGRHVDAEVLPVPLRPERARQAREARPRPLQGDPATLREEIAPALHVLLGLLRQGRFPFRRGGGCARCAYTIACRFGHVPSEARVGAAAAHAAYFSLHGGGA